MKTVFLTGATGFIGGYIVQRFVEEGWHVLALVHHSTSPTLLRYSQDGTVTLLHGDVRDAIGIRAAILAELQNQERQLDAIIHCAGRASDVGWRSEFRRVNFESTKIMVQLCKEWNVSRFVFVSTTDVYGLQDFQGEPEDGLSLHARPNNPYPEFKIAAEDYIRTSLPPWQFSIIRPAQVWGVGDQTLTSRIVDFLKWSPWIVHFGKWQGQNRWPLAHVKNVALAIYLAATLPDTAGKALNVLDDEKTTIDDFYRILAGIYLPHKTFRTVTLPFWLGQCIGFIVSCLSNLFHCKKPFMDPSFYALYAVSRNLDFSNLRMKALLAKAGYSLCTRESGIREIKASMQGERKIA